MTFKIRPAVDSDCARICEIRNEVIRTSDAILEDEPWEYSRWADWWEKREKGLPLLVLVDDAARVQGYALLGYFMDRSGYRVTGEVSIHLDPSVRGKGQGKILFNQLIEAGRLFGFYSIVARITETNATSIALHEKIGFTKVAHMPKVARKFGNFVDVLIYQKRFID